MITARHIFIGDIPALIYGEASGRVYLYVHGRMGCKEAAEGFARIAAGKGYQVLSFDLPEHGERGNSHRLLLPDSPDTVRAAAEYAFSAWKHVSLYACSMGAWMSLVMLADMPFENCLLQSPVVDMERLVRQMMASGGITEDELREKRVIETPLDTLRIDHLDWISARPVKNWPHSTHILYGGQDRLQSRELIGDFAARFGAALTVSETSDHPFMEEADAPVVEKWFRDNI